MLAVMPVTAMATSLSDADVLAYASAPFGYLEQTHVLGTHNGTPVIAEFICSDLCPDHTVRVVRYDLAPKQTCSAAGGVERSLTIPVSITAETKSFCFPKVVTDNWNKYQAKISWSKSGAEPK